MSQPHDEPCTASTRRALTHILQRSPALRCAAYLGAAVAIEQAAVMLYRCGPDMPAWMPLAIHMSAAPFVAALTWQFCRLDPSAATCHTIVKAQAARHAVVGLVLGATASAIVVGLPALFGWTHLVGHADRTGLGAQHLASLGYIALGNLAVIANEEVVFRGYGLDVATDAVGRSFAVLGSVTLFALNHGTDPLMLLGQGAFGLALTMVRLSQQSLWVSAGYHWAWNVVLMALVAPPDALPALIPVSEDGPALWQGRAQRRPGLIAIGVHLGVALAAALILKRRRGNVRGQH